MHREYHKWWSWRLNRDMELLVFGHGGARVLVFPTRNGRFYEYENLRLTEAIRHKLESGHLQLFCVDSLDGESLYNNRAHPRDRIYRHRQYEEYILNEVLPFMEIKNPHGCTIAHGCSLGAYHAANIAFRHPHLFCKLAAFSGRFDLTMNVESFRDLFDGYYDQDIYFHTPSHFLPNLDCGSRLGHLRQMDIVFVIGRDDPFLENNRYMSRTLHSKGISHQFCEWDERAHRGRYWRKMASIYL